MLDRTIAPEIHPISNFELVAPHTKVLKNGVTLRIINAGVQPVIGLFFLFKAGNWYAPSKEVSFFTSKMLIEGTARLKAQQITEEMDQYGAFLELSAGFDYTSVDLYCLAKYLRPLASLMRELINESVFPQSEMGNVKNITAQNLKVNYEKTSFLASMYFREKLFGKDHPYGTELSQQGVAATDRDELFTFYQQSIQNKQFELVVAGQVGDREVDILEDVFGSFEAGSNATKSEYAALPVQTMAYREPFYFEKDNVLQTSLRIGKELFTRTNPDFIPFRVVNELLGGYFGSRLMKNIREEKGYTYGIYSSLITFQHAGYLIIGTDVNKEVRDETREEVFREIELLKNEEVDAEEMEMVKNYMKGAFINSLNTPFAIAEKYKSIYQQGLSDDYYKDYIAKLDAVSARQVQELANKYLSGDFIQVLVG